MICRFRTLLLSVSLFLPAIAGAAEYPEPDEGDFTTRDFKFASGETMPTLRLHFRTPGEIKRVPKGYAIVRPLSDQTRGYSSHPMAVLWKSQRVDLLERSERKSGL